MTKTINHKSPPDFPFTGSIISVGNSKSAYFFAATTPTDVDFTILTEHGVMQEAVESFWSDEQHRIEYKETVEELRDKFSKIPITIICSTNPQRFKYWLKKILPIIPEERKKDVIFFLPQSPNPNFEELSRLGFSVAMLDYYPGIGGVVHDEETKISKATAGVKEQTYCTFSDSSKFADGVLLQNIQHLIAGQNLEVTRNLNDFLLAPTNALLHLCGNIAHIASVLIEDKSIMEAKTAEEFFEQFDAKTGEMSREEIIAAVGTKLHGRGFYREMPKVAADVLMQRAGDEIAQLVRFYKIKVWHQKIFLITRHNIYAASIKPNG